MGFPQKNTEIITVEKVSKGPFRMHEIERYLHHINGELMGFEVYEPNILKDWVFVSALALNDFQRRTLQEELDKELNPTNPAA
ncbi:hypothetical protein [Bdellovibrio sp. HCB288]|uniref:hypothetical protein n=1 Tax=Bdellovibrio sp. HCB288 TaxID=3394355 RepID=UPI0039B6E243